MNANQSKFNTQSLFVGSTILITGVTVVTLCLPTPAQNSVPAHSANAVVAAASAVVTPNPRAEILSQTDTALSMRFVDVTDEKITLDFVRGNSNETWKTTSTASPGILFGNPDPRYAGAALRRSLGITSDQAITTFESGIANRHMEDMTIFKTFSGMAVGLWQQGAITEIHYVGDWVQEMQVTAAAEEGNMPMCEAAVAECCNSAPGSGPGVWPPNIDSCVAAVQCEGAHKDQACACLTSACQHCPHPAPADDPSTPEPEDPCTPEERAISNTACNTGGPACEVEPPPPPPVTIEDIFHLIQQILDLLQEWLDNQLWT